MIQKQNKSEVGLYIPYILILSIYFLKTTDTLGYFSLFLIMMNWIYIYINEISHGSELISLKLMILAIPLSFISITGSYKNLIFFNWFNVFSLFFFVETFVGLISYRNKDQDNKNLSIPTYILLMPITWLVAFVINTNILGGGLGQFLLHIFYFVVLLAAFIYSRLFRVDEEPLKKMYNNMTLITALFVIAQFLLMRLFNVSLGRIREYGSYRLAFGFLNFDYSFLSLLLVSNAFTNIRNIYKQNKVNLLELGQLFLLIIASIITTARTGLVALAGAIFIYVIFEIIFNEQKEFSRAKKVFVSLILVSIAVISVLIIFQARGIKSSGRIKSYVLAFDTFLNFPLFGNGLSYIAGSSKPHNLFFQLLSQMGLFVTIFTLSTYSYFMYDIYMKSDKSIFYNLITVFIGSMFIPDIFVSRFLSVLLMIGFFGKKIKKSSYTVAHVVSSGGYSGAENIAVEIIRHSPRNIKSYYISEPGPIQSVLRENEIPHLALHNNRARELSKEVRRKNIDIIYAHDFKASILSSILFPSRKIVAHIHQNPTWFSKLSIKSILFLFSSFFLSEIIYVSEKAQDSFKFSQLVKHKSRVIDNYINSERIISLANKDTETACSFDLLFLGRLEDVKDPFYFLDIVQEISRHQNITAGIIGDGNLKYDLTKEIEEKKLSETVTMLGYKNNPYGILKRSRVLVITSEWEGFGLTAVESMILGVPVVASNVGGLKSILSKGGGKLCNSKKEFVDGIFHYLNHSELQEGGSYKKYHDRYTNVEKWSENLADLFQDLE